MCFFNLHFWCKRASTAQRKMRLSGYVYREGFGRVIKLVYEKVLVVVDTREIFCREWALWVTFGESKVTENARRNVRNPFT